MDYESFKNGDGILYDASVLGDVSVLIGIFFRICFTIPHSGK